ncbi:MAG: hypothetical protein ACE5Q5_07915, partial [Nitrosarchaeum sp.]
PKKFPEYVIMYKTLTKKIVELKNEKVKTKYLESEKIEEKIRKYESERIKISNMFPENFFNNYSTE